MTGQLSAEAFGRYNIVTGRLEVEYKKRLTTPRVVLATASVEIQRAAAQGETGELDKEKKRKSAIVGQVEDGEGGVFAKGKAVYVRLRPNL